MSQGSDGLNFFKIKIFTRFLSIKKWKIYFSIRWLWLRQLYWHAWYCKCLHTVQHDMIMILDLTCNQALHYLTKYHQAWTKHFYDVLMMMMMLMVMISEWSVATSAISLCSSELFYLHFLFRCFQHSWRLSLNNWTWLDNSMCNVVVCTKQSSVLYFSCSSFVSIEKKKYRISETPSP